MRRQSEHAMRPVRLLIVCCLLMLPVLPDASQAYAMAWKKLLYEGKPPPATAYLLPFNGEYLLLMRGDADYKRMFISEQGVVSPTGFELKRPAMGACAGKRSILEYGNIETTSGAVASVMLSDRNFKEIALLPDDRAKKSFRPDGTLRNDSFYLVESCTFVVPNDGTEPFYMIAYMEIAYGSQGSSGEGYAYFLAALSEDGELLWTRQRPAGPPDERVRYKGISQARDRVYIYAVKEVGPKTARVYETFAAHLIEMTTRGEAQRTMPLPKECGITVSGHLGMPVSTVVDDTFLITPCEYLQERYICKKNLADGSTLVAKLPSRYDALYEIMSLPSGEIIARTFKALVWLDADLKPRGVYYLPLISCWTPASDKSFIFVSPEIVTSHVHYKNWIAKISLRDFAAPPAE